MKAIEYLKEINDIVYGFSSKDKPGTKASNSELRRWLERKSVRINGKFTNWDEEIEFPVTDLVLFPKNDKGRITIISK